MSPSYDQHPEAGTSHDPVNHPSRYASDPSGSELVPFNFDGYQVRVIVDLEGNPWWVAGDVCAALGIGNARMATQRLDADDVSTADVVDSAGRRNPNTNIVNESGLWDLVLDSRKPEARRFRKWVTSEVLPSIRKTGSYSVVPKSFAEALELAAKQQREIEAVLSRVAELEPAAEQFHRWQLSGDTVYVVEWAKSIGLTQPKAYEALRECGVLFKQQHDGVAFNVPKRAYEQYFVMVDDFLPGPGRWTKVPKITAEGQVVLAELLIERGWLAP